MKEIGPSLDRESMDNLNGNFDELDYKIRQTINNVSTKAFEQVKASARIEWLAPVNTFSSLKTVYPNAREGHASMTKDDGKVFRLNDKKTWIEIQGLNPTAINEVENRLTSSSEKSGIRGWLSDLQINRNKKIVFLGDSTSDGPAGSAQFLYECINRFYLNSGDLLEGVSVVDRGSSGNTLENFNKNIPANRGIETIIADKADLYIISYGINDVRLGQTTLDQLIHRLKYTIERILNETQGYILLRIPNSLGSDDPAGTNYVQPVSAGQRYTDILWNAYQSLKGKYPRVDIIDMQTLVFGRSSKSVSGNELMIDPLHPSREGYYRIARNIAEYIGLPPVIRQDLIVDAEAKNKNAPYLNYPKLLEGENDRYELIAKGYFVGMGSNYLDFALDPTQAFKVQRGDIIKVGDKLAYDLNTSFTATASGANTRIAGGVNFANFGTNNKGMVKVFRKKGAVIKSEGIQASGISGQILRYFSVPLMRINTIDCRLAKPVATNLTFILKEIYQNTIKEIATITFNTNVMSGTVTWNNSSAPNSFYDTNHGVDRGSLFYIEASSTSYAGEVLLNVKLTS